MYTDINKANVLILQAESLLEEALAASNPQSYLHDLLAVSLRNIAVVHSKLDVAESLAQKNY